MVTVPSWCTRPTNSGSPSSVSPPGIAFGGMLPPLTGTQVGLQPQRTCGSAMGTFFKLGIIALCLFNRFFYTFSDTSLRVRACARECIHQASASAAKFRAPKPKGFLTINLRISIPENINTRNRVLQYLS
ncbi:hypothetical protein ALC57_12385 [Trachymyrmex cornetzi]|uniref:Uncharacterized protein n=1 Tax=Trachymyrmex cornetzi TaxID=471704 RepID=A0A195DR65_9HYME|nr:hypothetical protein ALC57_12385 [Trachymyrmex cornetzi]